jgi:hypothetical protein
MLGGSLSPHHGASSGSDVIHQLLIKFSAFVRYWRRNETVHLLFTDFKKTYASVRREVLFGVPMKLVRLIKMCLNEPNS